MRTLRVVAVACLTLFCAALWLENLSTLARAGEKNAMRLILVSVKVKETNKDGKSWDIDNGKPDLCVRIKNLSDTSAKEFTSATKDDTFEAKYDAPTFLVTDGAILEIEVLDKDAAIDDSVGKTKYTITKERMKDGNVTLSFDQVTALRLEFKKP
jgi:hypothetical protein